MDALLDGLNAAQHRAVTSPASVLQVLAPPGSGKTKTLTARVAYHLLEHKYRPWDLVVCTFTIKAAREMRDRICGLVGEKTAAKLVLGTFHSVARRYLVSYGQHIGIAKNFGIADSADSIAIIKRIVKRRNYGVDPKGARARISGMKAKNIKSGQTNPKGVDQQEFAAVYEEYEETLKSSNLLDYDDLLLRCVDLLIEYPQCVNNVEVVLIDEFQDTNNVQYKLMGLLAQRHNRITIVGDPDQSIYGFRSAEIKNLNQMQAQWHDTIVINLEENYRSSGAILASAMTVIEQDKARPQKRLLATHSVGEMPVFRKLPTAMDEAKWLVAEIKRVHILTGRLLTYNDFAVLLRSAALSNSIERELGRAGIPYRMVGGHRFFDRVEVKIILDYLRVINHPDHNDAVLRTINTPSRKVGEETCKKLLAEAEEKKTSLWRLALGSAQGTSKPRTAISKPAQKGIESFVNIILTSQKRLDGLENQDGGLFDLMVHLLKKLSFEEYLKKQYPETEEFGSRWDNVQELMTLATGMSMDDAVNDNEALPVIDAAEQRERSQAADALTTFLSNVALSTEVEKSEGEATPQVTISTIHGAKGLEWPVVFIPAAYKGSIPHSRAEDHDEERRLLYVGMTRAQALLYISCPMRSSQYQDTELSPFLDSTDNMARQGPPITFTATQGFARVLRRACPAEQTLHQAQTEVDRLEDDAYPLDGESCNPEGSYWVGDRNANASDFSRREKVDDDHGFKGNRWNERASTTNTNVATSINQMQHFSVASTTMNSGFMSAGMAWTQQREQEQAKKVQQAINRSVSSSLHEFNQRPALKTQGSGQGNIKSFFGPPRRTLGPSSAHGRSTPARPATGGAEKGSSQGPGTFTPTPTGLAAMRRPNREIQALQDISNTSASQPPRSLQPADNSVRKPRLTPMDNRPRKRPHSESESETPRYILLSSSPAPPEDSERGNAPTEGHAGNAMGSREEDIRVELIARPTGFRPASTLHRTSVGQRPNVAPQRKTLGVKRSMNGWSARMAKQ
ncbi:UvrD-helicase-domain-containing protein [Pseudovirgaria hyperparasitica]|uniref:DNA 3'-5' helicase n=1 Tax=Pseudovirgaria hyperparasitica TaxID=470096 RepID=A0A6A6VZ42_9PEZI|nr:UvrD-helicase-domain-containing protein [Pseudovirgaria hyperparasitica]KAF2755024.1 UvrD-helicase-domain-containing protein [Pseudovirgaria hyperparasitica]